MPAIFAILFKLFILFIDRSAFNRTKLGITYLCLWFVLFVANILELIGYYYGTSLALTTLLLRIYYVSLVWLVAFLLQICWLIVSDSISKKIEFTNYSFALLISGFLLFGDHLIAGSTSAGPTVTRVSGDFYLVFPIYTLAMLVAAIVSCVYGYWILKNQYKKIQLVRMLLSVSFLVITFFFAFLCLYLNINLTGAFFLPLGISGFLWVVNNTVLSQALFDIRVHIPFMAMHKIYRAEKEVYYVYQDGKEMNAEEKKRIREIAYIKRALIINDTQQDAADALGVSSSTISKKRKEYRIPFRI